MASKRQIEASRRNGRLSKGPVSESGRARSKRNTTRHGLSGTGTVLPEDMGEAVNTRYADWFAALKPYHDIDEAFVRWISTDSILYEGAQRYLVVQVNMQAKAAREDWDADRYQQALDLASELEKDPPKFADRLRSFKQGAELLIERWESLETILRDRGQWSEAQRRMALDLLGVHPDLRDGPTPLDPEEGETEIEALRAAVAAELEALRDRVAGRLAEKDEDERSAAELGYPAVDSPGVKLAKRYLGSIQRRLAWAFGKLHQIKARHIDPNDRSAFRLSREFELMYQEIAAKVAAAAPPLIGEPMTPRDIESIRAIPLPEDEPSPELTPAVAGEPVATAPEWPTPEPPASSLPVPRHSDPARPPDPPPG